MTVFARIACAGDVAVRVRRCAASHPSHQHCAESSSSAVYVVVDGDDAMRIDVERWLESVRDGDRDMTWAAWCARGQR